MYLKIQRIILLLFVALTAVSCKKVTLEEQIDKIYNYFQNENTTAVATLERVSNDYPARMSGSQNNDEAIDYFTYILAEEVGIKHIWHQEVEVPNWDPGVTKVTMNLSNGTVVELPAIALGLNTGTSGQDITAQVVEVKSYEELETLRYKDKIVFFNGAMEDGFSYGKHAWQRSRGASLVTDKGAKAVLVRSISNHLGDTPHTGACHDRDSTVAVPAAAISTNAADQLSEALKMDKKLTVTINSTAHNRPEPAIGRNLVAEIPGKVNPNHIILISAHVDSWFNSQGAHDNASGCVAAIEVLRAYKELRMKPRNTIRIVLYQDEEMNLSGLKEFARIAREKGESFLFDLEIDSGAGKPVGFHIFDSEDYFTKMEEVLTPYLEPRGLTLTYNDSDRDWPLKTYYTLVSDREEYFKYHHSSLDNFENINPETFKESIAAITTFVFLMD
ncbi:MAG TPA: M20/M25/M40 family metallo-hydrolase [Bacteroidales bacterium]|nr:M20/M25/M40 family metallo-hydrolase [Bacteroidales bacterium]HPK30463.1 M20/M25/M40 family metallo-hydrolase [Bacteroidales bacterium]